MCSIFIGLSAYYDVYRRIKWLEDYNPTVSSSEARRSGQIDGDVSAVAELKSVKVVTKIVKSLPKIREVYPVQSPQQIITGIPLQTPVTICRRCFQGHVEGSNSIDEECTVNSLYI